MKTIIGMLLIGLVGTSGALATTVGLSGGNFTVNGPEKFLLGVSYYDALNWHTSDLDSLQQRGFNLIRIMLDKNWDWLRNRETTPGVESIFNADGTIKTAEGNAIQSLIEAADARGLVVDVTILYADNDGTNSAVWLKTLDARRAAIQNAVARYSAHPNVLFDIVNEHNLGTFANSDTTEMRLYMRSARAGSATAIVSYSSTEYQGPHLLNADETARPTGIDAKLANGVDMLIPHNTRESDWVALSGTRAAALRNYLDSVGRENVPVYFQEESRIGSGPNNTAAEFLRAATEARKAGAAGWVFHTDAGFDLATDTWFNQLDPVEHEVVNSIAGGRGGVNSAVRTPPAPINFRILDVQ